MHTNITIICLVFYVLQLCTADLSSPFVTRGEYNDYAVLTDDMILYWSGDETTNIMELAMVAKVEGWLAIAVDPDADGVTNSECYTGYIDQNTNTTVLHTTHLGVFGGPPELIEDLSPPGFDNVIKFVGGYREGYTTIKFTRPIVSNGLYQKSFRPGFMRMSWAFHKTNKDIFAIHTGRGKLFIDFKMWRNVPAVGVFQFHLVITGAWVVFKIIIGLLTTGYLLPGRLKKNPVHSVLFYRKMLPVSSHKALFFYNWVADLTLGEMYFVVSYILLSTTWWLWGYFNAVILGHLAPVSRGFAWINIFNLSVLLLPVTKYSAWLYIFGIPIERSIRFHIAISWVNVIVAFVHGLIMAITYAMNPYLGASYAFEYVPTRPYLALPGTIAWALFLVVALVSLPIIRRRFWELFVYIHVILGVTAIALTVLHSTVIQSLPYFAASILLYLVDLLLRFVLGVCIPSKLVSAEHIEDIGITKIVIQKPSLSKEVHGAWFLVWIDKVSPTEWHPFSIANCATTDHKSTYELFIKDMAAGNERGGRTFAQRWTRRLTNAVKSDSKFASSAHVRICGPFGHISHPYETYHRVVLVAGGIGITAVFGIFKHLESNFKQYNGDRKVTLVWTVRSEKMWSMFPDLISSCGGAQFGNHANVQLYLTKSKDDDALLPSGAKRVSGRPSWTKVLNEVTEKAGDKYVSVIGCGPAQMLTQLQAACWNESNCERVFHFHKEVFEM